MTKSRSNATAPNAKGTLVVGNGTDASTTLAVASTAGYVLTVDSAEATGLKWAAVASSSGPAFRATISTAVSISSGAYVKLAFNTETFDTDSCYDPTTNYRFTPNKAGYYFVYIGAYLYANTGSSIILRLYKNGSVYLPAIWSSGNLAPQYASPTGSSFVYLNGSTDYIEAYGYHGGSSPGFGTENENAQFMAFWVRS